MPWVLWFRSWVRLCRRTSSVHWRSRCAPPGTEPASSLPAAQNSSLRVPLAVQYSLRYYRWAFVILCTSFCNRRTITLTEVRKRLIKRLMRWGEARCTRCASRSARGLLGWVRLATRSVCGAARAVARALRRATSSRAGCSYSAPQSVAALWPRARPATTFGLQSSNGMATSSNALCAMYVVLVKLLRVVLRY